MPELNNNKESSNKRESSIKNNNQEDNIVVGQSIESSSLFQCITNNHQSKQRKRNKSEKVFEFSEDCGSSSSKTVQKPSVQYNGAIFIQNPPSPIYKKSKAAKRQPKLNEIIMKDEIQKMQAALTSATDEQLKKLPISYIQEMRRLARTINRVFGENQSQ